jgi:hypothetical protein
MISPKPVYKHAVIGLAPRTGEIKQVAANRGRCALGIIYLAIALSWFTYEVITTLMDRPIVPKHCQEMLCVS